MASFMGMAERGMGANRGRPYEARQLEGLGGDNEPVQSKPDMGPQPVKNMNEPMQNSNEAVRQYQPSPWQNPMRNTGINPGGGSTPQPMGNPWQGGQLNHTSYIPDWAKPKPPVNVENPGPPQPMPKFTEVAGFSDFDPGLMGTLAQGQDFITREAKARGIDPSGWSPDKMNGIANQIGYKGGQLSGAQFNQARRLLFGS